MRYYTDYFLNKVLHDLLYQSPYEMLNELKINYDINYQNNYCVKLGLWLGSKSTRFGIQVRRFEKPSKFAWMVDLQLKSDEKLESKNLM